MSLKYALAEQFGLKLLPQNGWRNIEVQHLFSSRRVLTLELEPSHASLSVTHLAWWDLRRVLGKSR